MKKRLSVACIVIAYSLFLSACQEVPDEVKENMKQYGENKQIGEVDFSYCSVEEIQNLSMSDMSVTEKNIEFPATVDFSNVDDVGEVTFSFVDGYTEYAADYSLQHEIDEESFVDYEGVLNGDEGIVSNDENKRKYLYLGNNGEISYFEDFFYDMEDISDDSFVTEKMYIKRENFTNKKISYIDGEVDLSDEIAFVENEVKNTIKGIDEYDAEVRTVHILRCKDGGEYVLMNLQFTYNGMVLDFCGGAINISEAGDGYVGNMDNYINVGLSKEKKIDRLSVNGILEVYDYEKADTIIDFQTAVNIFENKMSSFNNVKVCEIEPIYMLEPVYDYKANDYYAKGKTHVNARPVYSFLIGFGEDDSEIAIVEGNELVYFNVDMLTGEVYTNLESKGYGT